MTSQVAGFATWEKVETIESSRASRFRMPAWAASFTLTLPAVVLTVVCLVAPILLFLLRSVTNPEIPHALPRTVVELRAWDGAGLPPDSAYTALGLDLREALSSGAAGDLARRLNYLFPGARTLIMRTAAGLKETGVSARDDLQRLDPRWEQPAIWALLRQESGLMTPSYFLAALDLKRTASGAVTPVDETNRIFVSLFGRTFVISLWVTVACALIGYPAAYVIATASARWTVVLLTLVLLPFWTPILVRSTAWIVLLQNEGLVNRALRWAGMIDGSLPLFANRFSVIVAMTHVLLPYMILPLYGVMKAVPPDLVRAASSLGANPWRAFVRVYLPQTLPGVFAGCLLVFILALGYYVTPALVGGPSDQMVSYFIALYTNETLNWGLASALSAILLGTTGLLYLLFVRVGHLKRVGI